MLLMPLWEVILEEFHPGTLYEIDISQCKRTIPLEMVQQ